MFRENRSRVAIKLTMKCIESMAGKGLISEMHEGKKKYKQRCIWVMQKWNNRT